MWENVVRRLNQSLGESSENKSPLHNIRIQWVCTVVKSYLVHCINWFVSTDEHDFSRSKCSTNTTFPLNIRFESRFYNCREPHAGNRKYNAKTAKEPFRPQSKPLFREFRKTTAAFRRQEYLQNRNLNWYKRSSEGKLKQVIIIVNYHHFICS